jgi:hypothetical protein
MKRVRFAFIIGVATVTVETIYGKIEAPRRSGQARVTTMEVAVNPEYISIPLHNTHHPGFFALVDATDEELVMKFTWRYIRSKQHNTAYAFAKIKRDGKWGNITLHRLLMGDPKGVLVDHINHDGLDCRRSNMRYATNQQNQFNQPKRRGSTSRYKGVHRPKGARFWKVNLRINGRPTYMGTFKTEREAALAYNEFAKQHYGEFACLNEIEKEKP